MSSFGAGDRNVGSSGVTAIAISSFPFSIVPILSRLVPGEDLDRDVARRGQRLHPRGALLRREDRLDPMGGLQKLRDDLSPLDEIAAALLSELLLLEGAQALQRRLANHARRT